MEANQKFFDASVSDKVPKVPPSIRKPSSTASKQSVIVDDSVTFVYDSGDEQGYDNIKTLDDVVNLHSAKPNVLLGIYPPLFSAFTDANGRFMTYVSVGDKVRYRNPTQADIKENPIRTVSRVYFKSLGDMSVIIAEFKEGNYSLTHLLTRIDGN